MRYYALIYYGDEGFIARRTPFREQHLRLVRDAHGRGELLLAGALGDPVTGALLVFRAADRSVAERFANADPYVTQGVASRWEVKPWAVVVGLQPDDFNPLAAAR
jgi:uncharacterized protein YciI